MATSKTKAIRFTERRVVNYPGKDALVFEKDSVHELIDTSANRWIKRGVAVALTETELKAHHKTLRAGPKTAVAGGNDGNAVDSTKTVAGENSGRDGERAQHDAGSGGFGSAVKRVLTGNK